jgi:hypothetical protein
VVYDYANRRVLEATAPLAEIEIGAAATIEVCERGHEPLPSADEFAHAVDILRHDRELRAWYSAHFTHDQAHESGAKLGPDLVPSGW